MLWDLSARQKEKSCIENGLHTETSLAEWEALRQNSIGFTKCSIKLNWDYAQDIS